MRKAIFLDRDGTLNVDHGYVHQIDDFQFIEGSIEALKQLKEITFTKLIAIVLRLFLSYCQNGLQIITTLLRTPHLA